MKTLKLLLCLACLAALQPLCRADGTATGVKNVLVIFKTHLDIGFTGLSSEVRQTYVDEFIPKAIETAQELSSEGGDARYVWTTGAWLIDTYMKQASPEAVSDLEAAIRRGDIVWNGVPYTVESESMGRDLFREMLGLSASLDSKYGKKTIAAKMTDVPGHTRSIVPLLSDAGIRLLHVGVNSAVAVPEVPPVCRWSDPVSGKSVILMYQSGYGDDMILPDGKTAVSINFTGDNHGPHTAQQVKEIFARLKGKYPNATLKATSLNEVAQVLSGMEGSLPEVSSEIGDTWIYGYGSSPLRMKKFRALSRLFSSWLEEGRIESGSQVAVDFATALGLVAEHTWGLDVKTHLRHWDTYGYDSFSAARDLPEFRKMEASWKEQDDYIDTAISLLPAGLQQEAKEAVQEAETVNMDTPKDSKPRFEPDSCGTYRMEYRGLGCSIGEISYQSYSEQDYIQFRDAYLISHVQWAVEDNGKPGLQESPARSATLTATADRCWKDSRGRTVCDLSFPEDGRVDSRVLPSAVQTSCRVSDGGRSVELEVRISGKPANRMPEAYWLTFRPEDLTGVVAEKTGEPVDLLDVVPGGNRQMHGIDRYVDMVTSKGTIRVWSPDAPLAVIGERNGIGFSKDKPEMDKGVHFCLYDNLWGTNFSMWWEGSISYRFRIEFMPE